MEKYTIINFAGRENEDPGLTEFYKNEDNRCYGREPVIAKMANGTLVCILLSGGLTEPHNQNVVLYKKSYDDGATWTPAEVLFSHSHRGLWGTEIFMELARPMMVISMYDGSCPFKLLQTFISWSDDNGETWSKPTMADPAMCTTSIRRGIRLSNGDILFPLYYTMAHDCLDWDPMQANKPGFWDGTHHECAVAVSTDNGKNYTRYGRMELPLPPLWETNCVEVSPGHIKMYMRADSPQTGFLALSESFDYGRTWTAPVLTDIPNPGTKVTAFTVGEKTCIISNFDSESRIHLELRTSTDGGKTFDSIIPLEDGEANFYYPHVIVDENEKKLYIAYENARLHILKKYTFDEIGL